MIELPETHKKIKFVFGGIMIMLAFVLILVSSTLVTDQQVILVAAISLICIGLCLFGALLMVGRNN